MFLIASGWAGDLILRQVAATMVLEQRPWLETLGRARRGEPRRAPATRLRFFPAPMLRLGRGRRGGDTRFGVPPPPPPISTLSG